jgi:hypothetical protein
MKTAVLAAVLLASVPLVAQEREVPKDSARLAIPGCARGRTFIVSERPEHEPMRSSADVEPGRRFRLNGPKKVLNDIKLREAMMLEITGLVRKSQVGGPGGIAVAGGRIRIGGSVPRDPLYTDPARDPRYSEVVIDVEGWRALGESCPEK